MHFPLQWGKQGKRTFFHKNTATKARRALYSTCLAAIPVTTEREWGVLSAVLLIAFFIMIWHRSIPVSSAATFVQSLNFIWFTYHHFGSSNNFFQHYTLEILLFFRGLDNFYCTNINSAVYFWLLDMAEVHSILIN